MIVINGFYSGTLSCLTVRPETHFRYNKKLEVLTIFIRSFINVE